MHPLRDKIMDDISQLTSVFRESSSKYINSKNKLYTIEELTDFIKSLDDEQLKKMMQLIAFCVIGFKSTPPPQS